jgi:hypothetical protein
MREPIAAGSSTQSTQARPQRQTGDNFLPTASTTAARMRADQTKQQSGGMKPAIANHGDPDECRVAIVPMTLHKEEPAQQSIIQYARRGCRAPLEVPTRLRMLESIISIVCVTSTHLV